MFQSQISWDLVGDVPVLGSPGLESHSFSGPLVQRLIPFMVKNSPLISNRNFPCSMLRTFALASAYLQEAWLSTVLLMESGCDRLCCHKGTLLSHFGFCCPVEDPLESSPALRHVTCFPSSGITCKLAEGVLCTVVKVSNKNVNH